MDTLQCQNTMLKRQTSRSPPEENGRSHGEHPVTVDIQDLEEADVVIAVMGPTGSGKSTFICSASGQGTEAVGSGLKSYTSDIRAVRFRDQKSGQHVVLVDTPGFNDTYKSDVDILNMVSIWLESSYKKNKLLSGIFYLHRITDNRVAGTSLKNLKVFRKLCGTHALEKVYLTTTMWDEVEESVCKSRLEELESQYWKTMINQGAQVVHCKHIDETPKTLVRKILKTEGNCRLLLQKEMVEMKRAIQETSARMELYCQLEALVKKQAVTLEKLIEAGEQAKDPKLASELEIECANLRAMIDRKLHDMQRLRIPWMKRFFSDPFKALRFLAFRMTSVPLQPNLRGPVPPQGPHSDPFSESNSWLSSEVERPTQPRRPNAEILSEFNSNLSSEGSTEVRISAIDLPPPSPSSQSNLPFSSAAEELAQLPASDADSSLPPSITSSPHSNLSSRIEDPAQPHNSNFPLIPLGVPDLTPFVAKQDDHHIASGGFSDVYKRLYTKDGLSKEVAVKAFRFRFQVHDTCLKMLRRELGIWRRLDHKNVVPFLGVAHGFGMQGVISLVSSWMPNGSLHDFLALHDRSLSPGHRLQLLLDVANGLYHLHSQKSPIVHGDLTSTNVLVDADYTARLADFGFASVIGGNREYLERFTKRPGALRFVAPEQVDPDHPQRTVKSDIYSFGCVALQVLSGERPWLEVQEDVAVIVQLSRGKNPNQPKSRVIENLHWDMIQRCWSAVDGRPSPEMIISDIEQFIDDCSPFLPLRDSVPLWSCQDEPDRGGLGGATPAL